MISIKELSIVTTLYYFRFGTDYHLTIKYIFFETMIKLI